jgi:hypothetical protein
VREQGGLRVAGRCELFRGAIETEIAQAKTESVIGSRERIASF